MVYARSKEWDDLSKVARTYFDYLPQGSNEKNRCHQQIGIVNHCVVKVNPYLFQIAQTLKDGRWYIRHRGCNSRVSLKGRKVEIEDLVQIGALSIIENFHKYNPEFCFSTFVGLYAGKDMYKKGSFESMLFHLSNSSWEKSRGILSRSSDRSDAIKKLSKVLTKVSESEKSVIANVIFQTFYGKYSSLNDPLPNSSDFNVKPTYENSIPSDEIPIDELVILNEVRYLLERSDLTPRKIKILFDRYFSDKTLTEVGYELNLSRERVRQIEDKALEEMISDLGLGNS